LLATSLGLFFAAASFKNSSAHAPNFGTSFLSGGRTGSPRSTRSTCARSASSAAFRVFTIGVPVSLSRRPSGNITRFRYRHCPFLGSLRTAMTNSFSHAHGGDLHASNSATPSPSRLPSCRSWRLRSCQPDESAVATSEIARTSTPARDLLVDDR
jgi:hypothetical protein